MINSLVDKIFLITTLNSSRFDYISNHLKENDINYELFIATNYKLFSNNIKVIDSGEETRPSLSLLSSFISIIYSAKLHNYNSIAILEDDCFFAENWKEKFQNFYSNIPNDWDLINLGYHPLHESDTIKEKINDFVYKPLNYHHTTHCMVVKNTCFDEYININNKFKYTMPSDYVFNEIYKNPSYKSFYPVEKFVYQLSVRNIGYEISGADLRFKSLIR